MGWAVMLGMAAYQAYASYSASRAATTAAGLQGEAAEKALKESAHQFDVSQAFAEKQWNTTQAQMAPFIAAGQGGVSKLSHLLGVSGVSPGMGGAGGTGETGGTPPPAREPDPPEGARPKPDDAPVVGKAQLRQPGRGRPEGAVIVGQAQTQPGVQPAPITPTGSTSGARTRGSTGASTFMTAPDGTTQDVPEELVDYYALRGARVTSNA